MKPEPALFPLTIAVPRLPHPDGGYLPDWLNEEIHAQHPHTFRTRATWTRCETCHEIILTGLDDPAIGTNATIDPTPLNPYQELICALTGRSTYRLHHHGNEARIQTRDRYQPPAGTPHTPPVVPAHVCFQRFPGLTIRPAPERTHHDHPPF